MTSTMVEPLQNVASGSHRPLSKMPSSRTLNFVSPAGARPKLCRSATVANKPASKIAKTSPGRGLTLRIEDDMQVFSMQSIRSAPAKSVRRLPPVPVPSMPVAGSAQDSMPIPPYTAPVGHAGEPITFRSVRPLPSPPAMPTTPHRTPIRHSSPGYSPPTTRQAAAKPLPVPALPVEPLAFSRSTHEETRLANHRQTLPNIKRPSEAPPPMPFSQPLNKISNDAFESSRKADEDTISPNSDDEDDDVEEAVIQLGNRIVLRTASTISLHSDLTSDEEEMPPPVPPLPPLIRKVVPNMSKDEKEEHVDYAWVLSNRMLYRQQSPQFQSKWIREKNGKRYTEQDYENIIQALRSL